MACCESCTLRRFRCSCLRCDITTDSSWYRIKNQIILGCMIGQIIMKYNVNMSLIDRLTSSCWWRKGNPFDERWPMHELNGGTAIVFTHWDVGRSVVRMVEMVGRDGPSSASGPCTSWTAAQLSCLFTETTIGWAVSRYRSVVGWPVGRTFVR